MLEHAQEKYVLIVDDVALMRRLLGKMLATMGVESQEAENAADARQAVQRRLPAVILLDILMPKGNGLEFCQWLRSNRMTEHIPVIACTSLQERKHVQAALKAGVNDYLCKPIDKKRLRSSLEKHLAPASAPQTANAD